MIATHLALSKSDGMCIMGPSIAHYPIENKYQRERRSTVDPSWLTNEPLQWTGTRGDIWRFCV
jgi:hypothetical protein